MSSLFARLLGWLGEGAACVPPSPSLDPSRQLAANLARLRRELRQKQAGQDDPETDHRSHEYEWCISTVALFEEPRHGRYGRGHAGYTILEGMQPESCGLEVPYGAMIAWCTAGVLLLIMRPWLPTSAPGRPTDDADMT